MTIRRISLAVGAIALVVIVAVAWVAVAAVRDTRENKTVDARSSQFPDDVAKVAFLAKYLKMNSDVGAAEFHVVYHDNSGGLVPGPSDWDIQAMMKMTPSNVPAWTAGLQRATGQAVDLKWADALRPPGERWAVRSEPEIYTRGKTVVAAFAAEGIVIKRTRSD